MFKQSRDFMNEVKNSLETGDNAYFKIFGSFIVKTREKNRQKIFVQQPTHHNLPKASLQNNQKKTIQPVRYASLCKEETARPRKVQRAPKIGVS
jgi:lysine/ornithine N-monooxygenase